MKKQVLAGALAASIAAVSIAGASLAYFTDTKDADNVFSVGNVTIELTEPNWELEGKAEAEDMYPGEAVKKDPTVKNIGANPAFVRVKVEFPEGVDFTYRTDYVEGKLGDKWVDGGDGYFYYEGVLSNEEGQNVTDALFDQVVLSTDVENDVNGAQQHIYVTAQAVQAQGAKASWADVQNMTVADIAAWFTTCGMDA